ncbi:prolipoprotein diacylglyceryl transferase [Abditibacteriota bacterium]|nr:prolipoprotein diacylglyceryl transferase [Abditibacteriota bacterium]
MRPILAVIPALQSSFLWPIALVSLLVGGAFALKSRNSLPIALGAGLAVLAFLWTRGPITLHSYGLFLVLGFFVSTTLACLEAKRRGYDPNVLLDLAMPLLLVSVVCCRVLYFIIYPNQWQGMREALQIWNGGLSFHGALIGAPAVIAYYAWSRKIPFGTLGDLIAPGAFMGYAIGRIGCFMNGCCYGHACDLPWAVSFPDENNRSLDAAGNFLHMTPPSHPAQLYSTLMGTILFAVMWRMRLVPRFNRFPGQLTLIFFAFYAMERFIMEIFRNGATAPLAFGLSWLTQAQFASIVGLIVIGAIYGFMMRRPRQGAQLASSG